MTNEEAVKDICYGWLSTALDDGKNVGKKTSKSRMEIVTARTDTLFADLKPYLIPDVEIDTDKLAEGT